MIPVIMQIPWFLKFETTCVSYKKKVCDKSDDEDG